MVPCREFGPPFMLRATYEQLFRRLVAHGKNKGKSRFSRSRAGMRGPLSPRRRRNRAALARLLRGGALVSSQGLARRRCVPPHLRSIVYHPAAPCWRPRHYPLASRQGRDDRVRPRRADERTRRIGAGEPEIRGQRRLAAVQHGPLQSAVCVKRVALPEELRNTRPKRLRFLFINTVEKAIRHAWETLLRLSEATARVLADAPRPALAWV